MKTYQKPTLTKIEFRVDESLMEGSQFQFYSYPVESDDSTNPATPPVTVYRLANTNITSAY